MKKQLAALLCCVITIFSTLWAVPARAQTPADEIDGLLEGIVAFKLNECGAEDIQSWIDTGLAEGAGTLSETYILALHQSGQIYDYSAYSRSLLGYLSERDIPGAVTRQKYALSLMAANCENEFIARTADDSIGKLGVMSWIFGLHLLSNGVQREAYTAVDAVSALLDLRLPDGGWAVSGEASDVDVTAMAIQALAPYRNIEEAGTAIDSALAFLSSQQLDSGAFASYGVECSESTAQVIIALCALDIDCRSDGRFLKNGRSPLDGLSRFWLEDGSFAHEAGGAYNHMATSQAFAALTAMQRQRDGLGSLYILDPQPDNTVTLPSPTKQAGWKVWALAVIAAAAAGACAALYILSKRNIRNFAAVGAAAIILAAVMLTLDIQKPSDYYGTELSKTDIIGSVTVTIRCDTIAGAQDSPYIPADGVILDTVELPISEGDTAYDLLTEAARKYSIHLESEGAPGMSYISGINYIYEFQHGELSGWMFRVNGELPSVGCDAFVLRDGDRIEWLYSLDMGKDLD